MSPLRKRTPAPRPQRISALAALAALTLPYPAIADGVSAEYRGSPFSDAAYRLEQQREANTPKQAYRAYAPALQLWSGSTPAGSGWVGKEEPEASIGLSEPDRDGRRVIRYRAKLNNYRYAAFGWNWQSTNGKPVDLSEFDAVSFSIKVSGPATPQEMFFGLSESQPAPLSLRDYDPEFSNGSWHRITIPKSAMKWSDGFDLQTEAKGFVFKTFVWNPSDFEVELDAFTFDKAVVPSVSRDDASMKERALGVCQKIPGRLECAFYDLGGEGIAFHDTTPINILSAVLNQNRGHQRAHATSYHWNFRRDEAVDISYVKDWADLNHPNLVDPPTNQLYIGGTEDGEWCNYSIAVAEPGTYKIIAAYGNVADVKPIRFSLNGKPAAECTFKVVTGGMHSWTRADVGEITFPSPGIQVLTLHYGRGYNLGYFDFVKVR